MAEFYVPLAVSGASQVGDDDLLHGGRRDHRDERETVTLTGFNLLRMPR
jgi:hypothetical protein